MCVKEKKKKKTGEMRKDRRGEKKTGEGWREMR